MVSSGINAEYMGSLSSAPRQLTTTTMGDMANAACMADGFDNIQKLPNPVPGCPNFRRVPGFKVYCCGQPTIAGFEAALTKVCGDTYPKDGPIIWFNLRQEPDVYVNGEPSVLAHQTDWRVRKNWEMSPEILPSLMK
eukprot:TRINITY_DN1166_c0_g1_i2.p1 TRINITY_DN1166_c0_g1~~TRINITY_DN1166_c0_g1_i2.p1  ORF type:complete len:137 (-),score=50.07 TRINITY_DN1166_c0_g1_i2:89-499(-)